MPKAIIIDAPGGPDVMKWRDAPVPEPGDEEVLIKQTAVGMNFLDIYYRSGMYPLERYPFTPGIEGCGIVIRPGKKTKHVMVGDRVAYAMGPLGAYAEYRVIPESFLVRVPHDISNEQAASVLFRGLTAHYLVRRTYNVNADSTVLVHAAAGGVGGLICQWAKYLKATVIGTVGSDDKISTAHEFGCDAVINYRTENVAARVRDITGGKGANVAYDAVGKDTFDASLDSLARFGMFVSYGQSSGPIPAFDIGELRNRGSLFATRPSVFDYKEDFDEYHFSAAEVFDMVLRRHLRLHIMQSFYLEDAAFAHTQLEQGKTKGPSVLIVNK